MPMSTPPHCFYRLFPFLECIALRYHIYLPLSIPYARNCVKFPGVLVEETTKGTVGAPLAACLTRALPCKRAPYIM